MCVRLWSAFGANSLKRLLQWCFQTKGGTRCPSTETNHLSVIRGSGGSVGINWPCVTVVAFLVSWADLFRSSTRLGKSTDGCLTVLWCGDPPSANCDCMRVLGAGWTLTFSVASGVVFPFQASWRVFRARTRRTCCWRNALFSLAVCFFLEASLWYPMAMDLLSFDSLPIYSWGSFPKMTSYIRDDNIGNRNGFNSGKSIKLLLNLFYPWYDNQYY